MPETEVLSDSREDRLRASARRIGLSLLVAIPSTAIATGLLFLVPPNLALVAGLAGKACFLTGESTKRPRLVGLGGVVMFAGVLSWALRK